MPYERLRVCLKAPALITVAAHWNSVRGERLMPAWRDIDPIAFAQFLPLVWAWRWASRLATFIGRLAGEEIILRAGKSNRGRRLEEVLPDVSSDARDTIIARWKRVIDVPGVEYSQGTVYSSSGRMGEGERVMLPVGAGGQRADTVFGATVYRFDDRRPWDERLSSDPIRNEVIEFFPLQTRNV